MIARWWSALVDLVAPRPQVSVAPDRLTSVRPLAEVPARATLAPATAAAVVDGGVVQLSIAEASWPQSLRPVVRRRPSWREPMLVTWSTRQHPVTVAIPAVVSGDGHGLRVVVTFQAILAPSSQPGQRDVALPETAEQLADALFPVIAPVLHERARRESGATVYGTWSADASLRAALLTRVQSTLADVATVHGEPLVEVHSPFFEADGERRVERQVAQSRLVDLEEQSRIRGAVALVAERERIDALQRDAEFDAVETLVRHDQVLRQRALAQELEEADLQLVIARAERARRQADAVVEMIATATKVQTAALESAERMADALRSQVSRLSGNGFTAQETLRIHELLAEAARSALSPHDVLAALQKGVSAPLSLVDPFRKLEGLHRVHSGTRLPAVFDGETLWSLVVMRVTRRRHGLLWLRASPVALLKVVGRPGERTLDYWISRDMRDLELGSSTIRCCLEEAFEGAATLRFATAVRH